METKLSSSVWHQHRHISPLIFNIPYQRVEIFPIFSDINTNKSFLHSQKIKENIFDAKKSYLDHSLMSIDTNKESTSELRDDEEKPYNNNHNNIESSASLLSSSSSINRKSSSGKKISFKIKKQASLYYKRNILTPLNNNNNNNSNSNNKITNVPANKVAELTKKFNEMVERKNYWEDAKIKRIINRDESIISGKKSSSTSVVYRDSVKISRKPSVKTKPSIITEQKNIVIIKTTRKNSVKKSNNISDNNNKLINNTRAKFQKNLILHGSDEQLLLNRPKFLDLSQQNKIMQQTSSSQQQQNNSVKATIEIFEKRSSICLPAANNLLQSSNNNNNNNKPAIPEKSTVVKLLQNKITNNHHHRQKNVSKSRISAPKNEETDCSEFAEEKVQIINIPAVLPQRRCDSMYETLNLKKIQPETIKAQSVDNLVAVPNSSFLWKDKSPSSSRNSINNTASAAPEIPPKPLLIKKTIKKKMPLPASSSSSLESHHHPQYEEEEEEEEKADIVGYEKIKCNNQKNPSLSSPNDEKFTNYDEITTKASITEFKTDELSILENKDYDEIINKQEKIYEELISSNNINNNNNNKIDDGYEPIGNQSENIYETLRAFPLSRRAPQLPLPPRPPSSTRTETDTTENCYESIYTTTTTKKEGFYESIYGSQLTADSSGSNRDSVVSSEQKTNSIYGQPILKWDYNSDNNYYKPPSDLTISSDDRSDEWEDFSDNNEEDGNHIIVVREKNRSKKNGWSHHFREQLSKNNSKEIEEEPHSPLSDESDHHYESLYSSNNKDIEDFYYDSDSFESDTDSEISLEKIRFVDYNGMDITSAKLPEIPNNQSNGIMKFAEKNMKKLGRNFTKSFTRMKKHISIKADSITEDTSSNKKLKPKPTISIYENVETKNSILKPLLASQPVIIIETPASPSPESHPAEETDKNKPQQRVKEGFLTKFRRSMSLSAETAQEVTSNLNKETKTKSTFYLTETIDVDSVSSENPNESDKSLSPVLRTSRSPLTRPKCPPPPTPVLLDGQINRRDGKSNTWYAPDSVLKNRDQQQALINANNNNKRPNTTFWYAEIGLYHPQNNNSTPSTSSENSGSNLSTTPIKPFEIPRPVINKPFDYIIINHDDNESLNNLKNVEDIYYAESINSFGSTETKQDESLKQEIQLRLQDEPLYQFYDAAVFESISYDITEDFDSDNYEDVTEKEEKIIKIRPSAMELVTPQRNSICFTKTLWCEIPEVIHSSVLSSLNPHQKKLQEAKFEILTSEASYLNSLNVLTDHFISSFKICQILRKEEMDILFGHVEEVRTSSEKLLHDLEKCWQDNVLLYGICDVIQKHADENFNVYIAYCENQVLFDDELKSLKDRAGFSESLKQLELSEKCQSLTLYSFLMLPMQRITRWPLLVDAVLKRLLEQDPEYFACQYALATVNKIVSQCNEAARQKERLNELLKISKKIEFPDSIVKIKIVTPERWLIRCGAVVHMQSRNEDTTKLTFGKRFTKTSITMILFNNLFLIAKEKGDSYVVQQYCQRNMVELSTTDEMLTVPSAKEAQQKNLIFLTILENQDGKTVEYLLSCNSETDKERWVEALTPLKSEDPEETLYECWDCPQVSAVHNYAANQSDELGLNKGDVINVLRKMADGWYQGIRLRDGESGWFPANHTVEIANYHVRARNLKQRYRLLAFSGNYLKSK